MHPASDPARFGRVDEQPDPEFFVTFVDEANTLPFIDDVEDRAVAELRLTTGRRVLDIGCGTGDDTRRVAGIVAPDGEAVGLDVSEAMIAAARRRTEGTGLPATFVVGDACALDFDDGSFDAVRAERVLMHVPDPRRALAEMVRVTRPGGRLVVIDVDFDTCVFDLPDVALARRVVSAMAAAISTGHIGRQLRRRFHEAGVTEVAVDSRLVLITPEFLPHLVPGFLAGAVAAGLLSQDDADAFWEAIEVAQKEGDLFAAIPFFVVSGTKP